MSVKLDFAQFPKKISACAEQHTYIHTHTL